MVSFTKEELDQLWTAIEYTRGTIGAGSHIDNPDNPDWVLVHKARAESSAIFLQDAIELVGQNRKGVSE
jgi:hypothetical protein